MKEVEEKKNGEAKRWNVINIRMKWERRKKVKRKAKERTKNKLNLWCDVATLLVSHSFWFIQYHFNGTLVGIYYSNIYQRYNLLRQAIKSFLRTSQLFVQNRWLFNSNRIVLNEKKRTHNTAVDNYDSEMCLWLGTFCCESQLATHSVAFSSVTHTLTDTHTHIL